MNPEKDGGFITVQREAIAEIGARQSHDLMYSFKGSFRLLCVVNICVVDAL